jgi:hypothetical protein
MPVLYVDQVFLQLIRTGDAEEQKEKQDNTKMAGTQDGELSDTRFVTFCRRAFANDAQTQLLRLARPRLLLPFLLLKLRLKISKLRRYFYPRLPQNFPSSRNNTC